MLDMTDEIDSDAVQFSGNQTIVEEFDVEARLVVVAQVAGAVVVLVASLLLHCRVAPFLSGYQNWIESYLLISSVAAILLAFAYTWMPTKVFAVEVTLTGTLIVTLVGVASYLIWLYRKSVAKAARAKVAMMTRTVSSLARSGSRRSLSTVGSKINFDGGRRATAVPASLVFNLIPRRCSSIPAGQRGKGQLKGLSVYRVPPPPPGPPPPPRGPPPVDATSVTPEAFTPLDAAEAAVGVAHAASAESATSASAVAAATRSAAASASSAATSDDVERSSSFFRAFSLRPRPVVQAVAALAGSSSKYEQRMQRAREQKAAKADKARKKAIEQSVRDSKRRGVMGMDRNNGAVDIRSAKGVPTVRSSAMSERIESHRESRRETERESKRASEASARHSEVVEEEDEEDEEDAVPRPRAPLPPVVELSGLERFRSVFGRPSVGDRRKSSLPRAKAAVAAKVAGVVEAAHSPEESGAATLESVEVTVPPVPLAVRQAAAAQCACSPPPPARAPSVISEGRRPGARPGSCTGAVNFSNLRSLFQQKDEQQAARGVQRFRRSLTKKPAPYSSANE